MRIASAVKLGRSAFLLASSRPLCSFPIQHTRSAQCIFNRYGNITQRQELRYLSRSEFFWSQSSGIMDGAGVSAAGAEKPGSPSLEVDIEVVNSCGDPTEDGEGEEMDDTPAVDKSDGRYAYVDRGFTSELYKLEICNLPKFIGFQVCRSLVCCNVYLRALIWLILNSFPHTLPPILLGNPFPCALIPNLTSWTTILALSTHKHTPSSSALMEQPNCTNRLPALRVHNCTLMKLLL